jgi:hypothetical protein
MLLGNREIYQTDGVTAVLVAAVRTEISRIGWTVRGWGPLGHCVTRQLVTERPECGLTTNLCQKVGEAEREDTRGLKAP